MLDTPETQPIEAPVNTATSAEEIEALAARFRDHIVPSTNIDGWTGARQKRFLESIADGDTVRDACRFVKLSPASAYAFRRRPKGRAFDLGWRGADLLARERVAADLLIRAVEGQTVEITRADGSTVSKHHYDNRLAVQMLNRLDRYADASERTAPGHAARLVAADFDSYLEIVGNEGGPARAGLFMLAREGGEAASELEPVLALARADRMIRCGTAADDVRIADLDPAARGDWTAEQWARAEAAGLLVLAPPPPPPTPEPKPAQAAVTRQPVTTPAPDDSLGAAQSPVWFDEDSNQWHTCFPPPEDFMGDETRAWGHQNYERQLAPGEYATLGLVDPDSDEALADAEADRDAWFAANAAKAATSADPDAPAASPDAPDAHAPGTPAPAEGLDAPDPFDTRHDHGHPPQADPETRSSEEAR